MEEEEPGRWPTASEQLDVMETFLEGHGLLQAAHDSYDVFSRKQIRSIILEKPDVFAENDLRTRRFTWTVDHVSIAKPTFHEADGEERLLLPSEARLRKLTYAATVRVRFTYTEEDRPSGPPSEAGKRPVHAVTYSLVQQDVPFVAVPVMVRSHFCNTRDVQQIDSDGECPLDGGGYFVINGTEKAIIMQEDVRTNTPYVRVIPGGSRFSHVCEIRSLDEGKLRSTSTLYIFVTAPRGGRPPSVEVSVPFVESNVPLAIMFRLLDVESRQEMEDLVCTGTSNPSLRVLVRAALESDVRTGAYGISKEDIMASLEKGRGSAQARAKRVVHTVANEFLPHVGMTPDDPETSKRKAIVFGHAVRKLLLVYANQLPVDDRDDYGAKRIKLPGMLMALLFRQLYRSHQQSLQMALRRSIDAPRRLPPASFIAFRKLSALLASPLATGSWSLVKNGAGGGGGGSGSSAQTGVAHVLSRMAQVGTLSHLRRVNTRISREGKRPEPRQLNHGHWSVFCPAETPEGESCGLMQNLSLLCRVRVGARSEAIRTFVRSSPGFVSLLQSFGTALPPGAATVFVNGMPLGTTNLPIDLLEGFRERRRTGDFPRDASVVYVASVGEISISTDKGCPLRPVFDLQKTGTSRMSAALRLNNPVARWNALLTCGAVVYVDKDEERSDGVLIATDPSQQERYPDLRYTHCEIHPAAILGLCTNAVPYPDHNQSPRNVYSGAMMKQRMGHAVMNLPKRMDSLVFRLAYGQRPLVQTTPAALMRFDKLPGEQNPIVAVATYTDYNGEDAIIFNRGSIDRGLFRGEVMRTYRDEEPRGTSVTDKAPKATPVPVAGPRFSAIDPTDPRILGTRGGQEAYEALDEDGLPSPGDLLARSSSSAIIGKLVPLVTTQLSSEGRFKDVSTFVKSSSSNVSIARVVKTTGRADKTTVAVQTREQRIPMVGDKFASRHGQKGVAGIILSPEDMPFCEGSGIIPDMIVNPHGFPSRMTFGQHMEGILGKAVCVSGAFVGDATAFTGSKSAPGSGGGFGTQAGGMALSDAKEVLRAHGYNPNGKERMVNGMTGQVMTAEIFISPVQYQRLKHMVDDKIHARARGPLSLLTRQPTEGRFRDGGHRFGEMEGNALVSHGAAAVLRDRIFEQSDAFGLPICDRCGMFAEDRAPERRWDKMEQQQEEGGERVLYLKRPRLWCRACASGDDVRPSKIPYATKLLFQEMSALHLAARIRFEKENSGGGPT